MPWLLPLVEALNIRLHLKGTGMSIIQEFTFKTTLSYKLFATKDIPCSDKLSIKVASIRLEGNLTHPPAPFPKRRGKREIDGYLALCAKYPSISPQKFPFKGDGSEKRINKSNRTTA